jgi:hypothetical protein
MTPRPVPDVNDAGYIAKLAELESYRRVLMIEAATGWTLPGATVAEKNAWLGDRPCDEVVRLSAFIEGTSGAARTAASFFSVR